MGTTDPVLADLARYETDLEAADIEYEERERVYLAVRNDILRFNSDRLSLQERKEIDNHDALISIELRMGRSMTKLEMADALNLRDEWIDTAATVVTNMRMAAAAAAQSRWGGIND